MSAKELFRRSKLPAGELEVAKRLHQAREGGRFTMDELARDCEATPSALKHYEHGAAPLPYDLATRICRRLDLNQRWLALGKEPLRPFVEPHALGEPVRRGKRLSLLEAFSAGFDSEMDRWLAANPQSVGKGQKEGASNPLRWTDAALLSAFANFARTLSAYESGTERKGLISFLFKLLFEIERRNDLHKPLAKSGTLGHLSAVLIAEKLKSRRAELKLTQGEAANLWGVSVFTLRKWEQGSRKPRGLALRQLEQILRSAGESKD